MRGSRIAAWAQAGDPGSSSVRGCLQRLSMRHVAWNACPDGGVDYESSGRCLRAPA
jgi:hypothetical protein